MSTPESKAVLLLSRRESLFERLTSILDFIKAQTTSLNVKKIKARYSVVNDVYQEYNKLEAQILEYNSTTPVSGKITYKKERMAMDDVLFEIQELYETLMESARDGAMQIAPNRLPKVKLPRFSGDFWQWNSFKAAFESMVHTAPIGNIEKFQRLRECVEGEPLRLLEHFTLSADNYPLAYQTLLDRYDNPRIAANTYLHSLLNYKPSSNDSRAALQEYLTHHYDSVKSFKALRIPNHYDYLLFQICYGHLDKRTQRAFDSKFSAETFPSYDDLMQFVQSQIRTLELHAVETERSGKGTVRHTFSITKPPSERDSEKISNSCYVCSSNHPLVNCPKFLSFTISQRYEMLQKNHLCFNCFRRHQRNLCTSDKRCKKCGRLHHTLLHSNGDENVKNLAPSSDSRPKEATPDKVLTHTITYPNPNSGVQQNFILLGTARGFINNPNNSKPRGSETIEVRILLDPGSQVSCMSQNLAEKLELPVKPKVTKIKGVSETAVQSSGRTDCVIYTNPKRTKGFKFNLLILPSISASLPKLQVPESVREKFRSYKLADPTFDQAGPIDVLIGADYFYDLMLDKRVIKGKPNGVPTVFGMVLIGEVPILGEISEQKTFSVTLDSLEQHLTKFWETEELQLIPPPRDDWCETFFKTTLERTSSGRYMVALPFNCDHPDRELGSNRENAIRRLLTMERRFNRNEELHHDYRAFLEEYHSLGHMSVAKAPGPYVIPHHAVFKESTTTKLRVVFDGSNPSDNGVSLNQLLHKGPKLQKDIFITITGFRKFKIALASDIKMMYRQILVRPQDRKYQRIFWRNDPEESPIEFELNTVTYGLSCSSYLAQRVLLQLVQDEGKDFPLAAETLMTQVYVDDIVSGGESVEEALRLYEELTKLLGRGGFFPRKWSSSSPQVLDHIPSEHKETPLNLEEQDGPMYKVLGVNWDPNLDSFTYKIENFKEVPTKRTVLSYIARMFDPLGWLAPFIFNCKHFMQLLWLEGLTWDNTLPPYLQEQWANIVSRVQCLSQVRIPRYIPMSLASNLQLIGFCDASEKGFAAVLYIRCIVGNHVTVHLLGGKTKVAPVKPMTIPRLELNAAHLLSKLFKSFKPVLERFSALPVFLFTDSQVVLGWLRTAPHKLKTYVCNRVVEILNITSPNFWGHISSEENAADCASRGLEPQNLVHHHIWWNGPDFLHQLTWEPHVSQSNPETLDLPETKRVFVSTVETDLEGIAQSIAKFSSLTKLSRVVAYVLRFAEKSRHKPSHSGPLKLCELKNAIKKCIWVTQSFYFPKEKTQIRAGTPVVTLRTLAPFLDQDDLVRVGGRLGSAPLPYEARHPLLIPYNSTLARLIACYYHKLTLHGGPQITRSAIQAQYWIPKAGNLIKSVIFACKSCRRHNPHPVVPMMGELPMSRFDQLRPFLRVGTDFAGPFTLKETPRRKAVLFKAYVCLFICFSTKAVHIEIVTSLSTEAFLAAFDRFSARRGLCAYLYSDNGTNFAGAARKMSEVSDFFFQNANPLEEQLTSRNVQWFFNPPAAPHFGGLWEAAVKSFKFHLNRVTTAHIFTLEEFTTLACRIEAILNSRPLCPLASTPSDAELFLTPGHFLVGAPLLSVPELPLTELRMNALTRWQLIGQCVQSFWKIWSKAYLQTLIPRKKRQVGKGAIGVGDVVFLRNEKTNPLSWPLARVEQLCEGKDGVCRVAKIRCNNRILTRPVHILSKVFENSIAQE